VETHHRIPDTLDELQAWSARLSASGGGSMARSAPSANCDPQQNWLHGAALGERYRFARTRLGARE
jgi:hypothetical protein